jgi:hypothetical protein
MGARKLRVPPALLRRAAALSFHLRLQPSEPGWLDMALAVPVMDTAKARRELDWEPRRSAVEALKDLLAGIRGREGIDTPPLAPDTGGRGRVREVLTGVGKRPG